MSPLGVDTVEKVDLGVNFFRQYRSDSGTAPRIRAPAAAAQLIACADERALLESDGSADRQYVDSSLGLDARRHNAGGDRRAADLLARVC